MSRAFLFDIGNVILHFDFTVAARRLAALSEAGSSEVLARLSPFKDALESGQISDDDFVSQAVARIGFRGSRDEFISIWSDIFTENTPMTALVRRLAGRHPLHLFSNTSGLHKTWFFNRYDVFPLFNGGLFSYEVRYLKPHENFYHEAIKQFHLDPAQTFYIDDLADNIETGKRLGFVTHHYDFRKHEALEQKMTRWLDGDEQARACGNGAPSPPQETFSSDARS